MEIKVNSEIGRLKKVLLHRPGKELENLTPDLLERLLFDDIPWLEVAQDEHDQFANLLRDRGVEVYYIENLVAEAIDSSEEAREEFLTTFVNEAIETNESINDMVKAKEVLRSYLESFSNTKEMVDKTIAGVRVAEIGDETLVKDDYYFIADPLPNLYFQRDPYASIANGASINTMYTVTRRRETLYSYIMFKYHSEFKNSDVKRWYGRDKEHSIEGGDQLVLNKNTLLVGRSQRTRFEAIEDIAHNILSDETNEINRVVAFDIGKSRKFMHLDTVFTQVDYDKFSVHPEAINEAMNIWYMTFDNGELKVEKKEGLALKEILEELTGIKDIKLLECGAGDPIASAREQWNDGANTLAIAPGEVVVYSRNPVTNNLLVENGIKINVMPSAELSRGRGGPRCMSMPLEREEI